MFFFRHYLLLLDTQYLLLNTLRGFLPLTQRNSVSVYNNYAQSPYVPNQQPAKSQSEKAADAAMEKWGSKVKTHRPQKMNVEHLAAVEEHETEHEEIVVGEPRVVQSMENTIPPDAHKNAKAIDFSQLRPKPQNNPKFFKKTK